MLSKFFVSLSIHNLKTGKFSISTVLLHSRQAGSIRKKFFSAFFLWDHILLLGWFIGIFSIMPQAFQMNLPKRNCIFNTLCLNIYIIINFIL